MSGDHDDELRELLRRADPSPSGAGPAVDPASLEAVMSEIRTEVPPEARRRPPWVFGPAVATAAAAMLAVLVLGGVWWSGRTPTPAPAPAVAASPAALTLADTTQDINASCMRPEPAMMREQVEVAFAGTVRSTSATASTVEVDHWYRGGSGPTVVTVKRPPAGDDLPGILYSPELAAGQRVLLVATDGALHVCDPSGPWSADGEALYTAAFGPGTPVP